MDQVQPIILAAGKGTRMKSDLPKVLLEVAGKPMLGHVLEATAALNTLPPIVVTGFGSEQVQAAYPECIFVEQGQQLGTGHAVQIAGERIPETSMALILYGDVPLIESETITKVVAAAESGFGLLTVHLDDPSGYGRIVRDSNGLVTSIVEHKDA